VAQLGGLTPGEVVEGTDAPERVEYAVWSGAGRTPAAGAFLAVLGVREEE